MKKHIPALATLALMLLLCLGILTGCDDDDNDSRSLATDAIAKDDPSYGYMVNSTAYRLLLDLEEEEKFNIVIDPGQILEMKLDTEKAHLVHVVVLTAAGRVFSEYDNSFYVDDVPLDNQLKDFLCSWYAEFVSVNGFANNFGS